MCRATLSCVTAKKVYDLDGFRAANQLKVFNIYLVSRARDVDNTYPSGVKWRYPITRRVSDGGDPILDGCMSWIRTIMRLIVSVH